jgi:leucyl aminopeptidase (aminopeptidase T)
MPGITTQSFARGLRVDFDEVERAGKALQRRLEGARQISVESSGGTNLTLTFGDSRRWTAQLGVIAPGTSVAFPAGALFAAPEAVDGVFVADASIGEFFGAREGLLSAAPVRFRIAGGLVTAVEAPGLPQLQAELEALLAVASHSNRIGAVAVGVNGGLAGAVGDASVDSTLPGLHLVVGDPAGRVPGVKWSARTSFLACGAGATVRAGNDTIVASGALA